MYIKFKILLKKLFYKVPFVWKLLEVFQGFIYVFDYYFYYKFWGKQNRFSINEINIEFASQCNLRCKFCSLDHDKPKTLITKEILEKFLLNFVTDNRFKSVKIINLHNGGEVLLHPKRVEMLELIKKYKTQAENLGMHFPKIHLLTNGMLLREKLSKEIIALDVLDMVGLSMDGGSPHAFENMRVNAKWPKFYQNLKDFCRINDESGHKIETYSICCLPGDKPLGIDWMETEFKDALNTLDRYELRRLHNWAGDILGVYTPKEKKHKIGCSLLMNTMVLLPNGDITVCCNDLNSKGVIGNILKRDLYDIYNSNERRKYLDLLLKGRKDELDLCKGCETF